MPVELVGLAELVQEPDDLVPVANGVRGELGRDHEVDRGTVGFLEVEQPPEERLGQHPLARVPLEGNRHELGVVIALAQLLDETVAQDLGAPVG